MPEDYITTSCRRVKRIHRAVHRGVSFALKETHRSPKCLVIGAKAEICRACSQCVSMAGIHCEHPRKDFLCWGCKDSVCQRRQGSSLSPGVIRPLPNAPSDVRGCEWRFRDRAHQADVSGVVGMHDLRADSERHSICTHVSKRSGFAHRPFVPTPRSGHVVLHRRQAGNGYANGNEVRGRISSDTRLAAQGMLSLSAEKMDGPEEGRGGERLAGWHPSPCAIGMKLDKQIPCLLP